MTFSSVGTTTMSFKNFVLASYVMTPKIHKAAPAEALDTVEEDDKPIVINTDKHKMFKVVAVSGRSMERLFIVDSGASYHLVDEDDLAEWERKTITKLQKPITMQSANGEVTAYYQAIVRVEMLGGLQVKALILKGTATV